MRKVLLTTTALVALGGVSAASALDISGFQRMGYHTWDDTGNTENDGANDTTISDYNRVVFTHSITGDSGLSASGYYRINNWAEAYHDLSLSGDFGTVSLGNYTTAGGFMYNSHLYNGTFVDNNNNTGTFDGVGDSRFGAYAAIADGGDNSVTYTAPAMGGFTFMATYMDDGSAGATAEALSSASGEPDVAAVAASGADVMEYGLAYSGDINGLGFRAHGITAKADDTTGSAGDELETQEFGLNVSSGPFEVRFTTSSRETNDTSGNATADVEVNEYSATYRASDDLTVGVITQSRKDKLDTTDNPKLDETVFGANYFIMPGLRVQASYVDFDYEGGTDNSGSQTNIALRIDF